MMDPKKEWEDINKYGLMHHVEYGCFSWMSMKAAIEIGGYMNNKTLVGNSFSKLRTILFNTLLPRTKSNKIFPNDEERLGERQIDNYLFTGMYLEKVLKHHKEQHKETYNRETPYQLKKGITKTYELSEDLARVITKITNDLGDLSKVSNENLESLYSLFLSFNRISAHQERGNRRSLVA